MLRLLQSLNIIRQIKEKKDGSWEEHIPVKRIRSIKAKITDSKLAAKWLLFIFLAILLK